MILGNGSTAHSSSSRRVEFLQGKRQNQTVVETQARPRRPTVRPNAPADGQRAAKAARCIAYHTDHTHRQWHAPRTVAASWGDLAGPAASDWSPRLHMAAAGR